MSDIKWTNEQCKAIDAGGNILVSAAAGSGKTAVLTERVVSRLLRSDNPLSADRLLVVTFTRLAAEEMKARIKSRVSQEAAGGSELARSQLRLLDRAVIGTLHSMCFEIIKENLVRLDLPFNMRIGDDIENREIRNAAVEQALESAYAERDDELFEELVDLFFAKRDDTPLEGTVIELLDFARVHPRYKDWLASCMEFYSAERPIQSVWGKALIAAGNDVAKGGMSLCKRALGLIDENPEIEPYRAAVCSDMRLFEQIAKNLGDGRWDDCRRLIFEFSHERLGRLAKGRASLGDGVKTLREEVKKTVSKLKYSVFVGSEQDFSDDITSLRPKIKRLFELVLKLDEIWFEKKKRAGIFEFSDLEQLALQLLTENKNNVLSPSAYALEFGQRFDDILVDECQDINKAQETIIEAVSSGKEIFLVGDVKQSIYRFRHASPELFVKRAERYRQGAENSRLLTLSGNFRSHPLIIDAVNETFSQLMSRGVGGVDYDAGHRLCAMGGWGEADEGMAAFYLLDKANRQQGQSAAQAEAQFVAKTVKELLNSGKTVGRGAGKRPMRPGDIAILMRSAKDRADIYRRELAGVGVESRMGLEGDFINSREIIVMHSLLKVLDNPTLDVGLAAVLLSPICKLSDDDLAQMRLAAPGKSLFEALKTAAGQNKKAEDALALIEKLRQKSVTVSVSELIYEIYALTGYETAVLARKPSERRHENLMLLASYAHEWQNRGHRRLGDFVAILDKMRLSDEKSSGAGDVGQVDYVCISTVHASKGLEWPVVILTDTARKHGFIRRDQSSGYILHPNLGFACVRRDYRRKLEFSTLPLSAARLVKARESLSEEMRILYVAMTRAKQRLIITASVNKPAERMEKIAVLAGSRPDEHTVAGATSFCDWLLTAAAAGGALRGNGNYPIAIETKAAAPEVIEPVPPELPRQSFDGRLYDTIKERLEYTYPFADAVNIAAKLSVSQLSHSFYSAGAFLGRPRFASSQSERSAHSARDAGSAMHRFMQLCSYEQAAKDLEGEIASVCERGGLTAAQAEMLDRRRLGAFFGSGLARRIMSSPKVYRELKLLADARVSKRYAHLTAKDGESTLLQGIADCVFFERGRPLVVDYKTDRVDDIAKLAERYEQQLNLYRDMLSHVLKKPVEGCILYSFWLNSHIEVKNS